MSLWNKAWRRFGPNPFLGQLRKAAGSGVERLILAWNRGMGDIPLGLYALLHMVREHLPHAAVLLVTRPDLADAARLLENVEVLVSANWRRGKPIDLAETLRHLGVAISPRDWLLSDPDPTYWCRWQLGHLVPRLPLPAAAPSPELEALPLGCIGLHLHSETLYGYEKNWSVELWRECCERLRQRTTQPFLLLGAHAASWKPDIAGVIDLRGQTSLTTLLWLLSHRCSHLVAPDSGVLSLLYYLDIQHPCRIVSLWADPKQGILKQGVAAPNDLLQHVPMVGRSCKVDRIPPKEVVDWLLSSREVPCSPLTF